MAVHRASKSFAELEAGSGAAEDELSPGLLPETRMRCTAGAGARDLGRVGAIRWHLKSVVRNLRVPSHDRAGVERLCR